MLRTPGQRPPRALYVIICSRHDTPVAAVEEDDEEECFGRAGKTVSVGMYWPYSKRPARGSPTPWPAELLLQRWSEAPSIVRAPRTLGPTLRAALGPTPRAGADTTCWDPAEGQKFKKEHLPRMSGPRIIHARTCVQQCTPMLRGSKMFE